MVHFGRKLLIRFTVFLFVFLLMIVLVISHFIFEGVTLVLVALVPGHCLSFTFYYTRNT